MITVIQPKMIVKYCSCCCYAKLLRPIVVCLDLILADRIPEKITEQYYYCL